MLFLPGVLAVGAAGEVPVLQERRGRPRGAPTLIAHANDKHADGRRHVPLAEPRHMRGLERGWTQAFS
jgi:hypothetical protein